MNQKKINRETLLNELESVRSGLSNQEVLEQSTCFIFQNGFVKTYNDEIACKQKSILDFTGAVQAEPLLQILRKMTEDEIKITTDDSEFLIEGKRRKAAIRMEREILLPVDRIEDSDDWKSLDEEFSEAVHLITQVTGTDESQFMITCVHLTDSYLEATDNYQASRFKIRTDINQECLIRKESIKHVVELGVTEFSETESWIHFRNPTGLVLSCRRYTEVVEDYPEVGSFLTFSGTSTSLPTTLSDAIEKAEVFSTVSVADNFVTVEMKSTGKLRIKGEGNFGWFTETKKVNYSGDDISFRISPKLLSDIAKKHNECEISRDRLKVESDNFTYVAGLLVDE